jgi:hypothetical protein
MPICFLIGALQQSLHAIRTRGAALAPAPT